MKNFKKVFDDFKLSNDVDKFIVTDSKTSILFPKYRETYFKETWKIIERIIKPFGIISRINFNLGVVEVKTTERLKDPYHFIKSRDFFKLISRGISVEQAAKIFNDDVFCEIIKISGLNRNKDTFIRKRKRLIGKKGITVRALEFLTKSYILIQGNTVSCMGTFKGIKEIRKIIIDCMKNIHPVLYIKNLIIKEKLKKDPFMKNISWTEYLPLYSAKFIKFKNDQDDRQIKKKLKQKFLKKSVLSYIEARKKISESISKIDYFNLIKKYNKL